MLIESQQQQQLGLEQIGKWRTFPSRKIYTRERTKWISFSLPFERPGRDRERDENWCEGWIYRFSSTFCSYRYPVICMESIVEIFDINFASYISLVQVQSHQIQLDQKSGRGNRANTRRKKSIKHRVDVSSWILNLCRIWMNFELVLPFRPSSQQLMRDQRPESNYNQRILAKSRRKSLSFPSILKTGCVSRLCVRQRAPCNEQARQDSH